MRAVEETVSWIIFLKEKTSARRSLTALLEALKASLLSSRRGPCKTTIAKKTLQLLPVATRQTFPSKYTFLTDFNPPLWLFSSVNHETFLEIFLAKINNIFRHQTVYWQKLPKKYFRKLSSTRTIIKSSSQVFHPRSLNETLSRTHPELILGSFIVSL